MSKKTKTSSTSTGTATTTPNAPSWIQGPAQNFYSEVGGLLGGSGPSASAFGPSALQQQAFAGARNLGGGSTAIGQGTDAVRGLLDYTPDSVTAGQLSSTDLNPYMNPYTQNVVDAASADFANANDLGLNSLRSMTPNGAYGGSRQMVAAGQLVGDNTRNFANTIAGLRQSGFQNAQQGAMFDIGNRMGADQFNSQQGLAGANFRLGAGRDLATLGTTQDANSRANLGLMGELGAQEQQANAQNDPAIQRAMWLRQLQGLLGVDLSQFIGQNVQSSGTQTGTTSTSDPWGTLATILQTAGQVGRG